MFFLTVTQLNEEKRNLPVKNTPKVVNLQGFNISTSKLHFSKDIHLVKSLQYKRVTILNLGKLARVSDESVLNHLM